MLENLLFGITSALAETSEATAEAAAELGEVSPLAAILQLVVPMALMVAVFYFMLIRPQRKKDKKVKEMLNALKKGDRITTIGGIYGTILNIKDETITLAVGQSGDKPTEMTIARWAVRGVEEVSVENDGEILA
ncbi:MAG: preprotein translocase subunit YajC [Clostridia bacterium]|nr:preprotein translocase subunit YajC [Clostridia bacterium]